MTGLRLLSAIFVLSGTAAAAPAEENALSRLGVPAWHQQGHPGRGITVAVLDSGFRGYRDRLGHEVPARVKCQSFRNDGDLEAKDSIHGLLCAEVVHAMV